MKKLIIFDLDGTLYDTAPGIHKSVNIILEQNGKDPLSLDIVKSCIGEGMLKLVTKIKGFAPESEEQIIKTYEEYKNVYREHFLEYSHLYDGVYEFLKQWQHDIAIVSNKNEWFVQETIKKTSLNEFNWLAIYGGNSFEKKKPDPMQVNAVINATNYNRDEIVFIGDSQPDIDAAKAADIKSVAVDFGYTDINELMACGANARISHYNELSPILKSL